MINITSKEISIIYKLILGRYISDNGAKTILKDLAICSIKDG